MSGSTEEVCYPGMRAKEGFLVEVILHWKDA